MCSSSDEDWMDRYRREIDMLACLLGQSLTPLPWQTNFKSLSCAIRRLRSDPRMDDDNANHANLKRTHYMLLRKGRDTSSQEGDFELVGFADVSQLVYLAFNLISSPLFNFAQDLASSETVEEQDRILKLTKRDVRAINNVHCRLFSWFFNFFNAGRLRDCQEEEQKHLLDEVQQLSRHLFRARFIRIRSISLGFAVSCQWCWLNLFH